jgi:uncharacterized membrane protein
MLLFVLKTALIIYITGFVISFVFFVAMMLMLKEPRYNKIHGVIALSMIWPFMLFGMVYAFSRIHKSMNLELNKKQQHGN